MNLKGWLILMIGLTLGVSATVAAAAEQIYVAGSIGHDVSWPNCQQQLPNDSAFGIVGVNGGRNFTKNPCFENQVGWFVTKGVPVAFYANTGYPGIAYGRQYAGWPKRCRKTDKLCLAYNYGYNAAKYTVDAAAGAIAQPDMWWLDVETGNSWTTDTKQNRQALAGLADGLRQIGGAGTIGFYSTPHQWQVITGGWQPNWSAPNWVATGSGSLETAKAYCSGRNFTGGGTWLTQYIKNNLDHNYVCP